MPAYPFMQVDASANRALSCNPSTELFTADKMDSVTRLTIAHEMNISKTSFLH
jgi:predicted PhzF superfamily epimerase YddE/YHI9